MFDKQTRPNQDTDLSRAVRHVGTAPPERIGKRRMEQVAHRNCVSKSQAVSLDHTKKGRRSLDNKVVTDETMHTCMHRSSPYHSYYTSTNISLTKHMRSMRQIKFPVASISINYVVGLAS